MIKRLLLILCAYFTCFSFSHADAPPTFSATTTAFLDQGALPVLYTCDGKNVSPSLTWTDAPAKTQAFAVVLADPDAPNGIFYHWILYNIPKEMTTLPQDLSHPPATIQVVKNSFGHAQYDGPCPPKGTAHTYYFTIFALDSKLTPPKEADAKSIVELIKKHSIGKVELSTVYSRWFN